MTVGTRRFFSVVFAFGDKFGLKLRKRCWFTIFQCKDPRLQRKILLRETVNIISCRKGYFNKNRETEKNER